MAVLALSGALLALPGLARAQTPDASTGPSAADPNAAAVAVVRIDGKGHGHGVGLSQWGAHTMARQGSSAATILNTFYPGTHLGSGSGEITVRVDERSTVNVSFPAGGEIRSGRDGSGGAEGFPIQVPAGAVVTVTKSDQGYQVSGSVVGASGSRVMAPAQDDCLIPGLCPTTTTPSSTTTTTTVPDTTLPDEETTTTTDPDATPEPSVPGTSPVPVWAVPAEGGTVTSVDRGRNYRGVLQIGGNLSVTNHVDVEDYLRGMIEVPGHWPAAAVQAQTIAARTFALRAMATGGSICDTDACQVYLGTARESAGLNAAVEATRGTVVLYGNGLAATFFSASAGGISATPVEGFGNQTEVPYLQAVEHPDADPQPWSVQFTPSEIGGRFGYSGTVSEVRVDEAGPSGRALTVTIDGDAGPMTMDAQDFRKQLDLRSTLYTVEMAMSDGSPITVPPESPSTTAPEIRSGVQMPVASEPIKFAVETTPDNPEIPWQWPAAAATGIVAVTASGMFAFAGRDRRRRALFAGHSGRVASWIRRRR